MTTPVARDEGRRHHYRHFYEARLPEGPLLVSVGNCQAESLRLLLDPDDAVSVRVPPVFELEDEEVGLLHRMLRRTAVLVVPPVTADYRGHPLGTDQLRASLPDDARCVVVPIARHAGLHPYQVVHHPPDGTAPPPVVPYHDLRVLRAALGGPPGPPLTTAMVRAVGAASVAEQRRRERATDVAVSDLLEHPGPEHLRTINHPGNPVLLGLARRVADRAGLTAPVDPGYALLDEVRAPVEPVVGETWGFDPGPGADRWRVGDRRIHPDEIAAEHRAWYLRHPDVARSAWAASAERVALLGLPLEDAS